MKFSRVLFSPKGAAALLALGVALSACTVVVDEDPPRPRPPRPGPEYCTREYDPVCAVRAGDRQTFSNACMADRAGYRVIRRGECRIGGGGGGGPDVSEPGACTTLYAPVCARRGGQLRTFPNSCEADASGYFVIDNGPC